MVILLLLLFITGAYGFLPKYANTKINIPTVHLPSSDLETIRQIRGVYGLIGPDFNISEVTNLYELFTGNGIIQACTFDDGKITFIKHYIETEKLVYERRFGKVLPSHFVSILFYLLNKINLMPNLLGLANTALVHIDGKHYALYERDLPYQIDMNLANIRTVSKKKVNGIESFSAHPTVHNGENLVSGDRSLVETIEYNVITKTVKFHQLTGDLVLQKTIETPMKYLPIVHDFISTQYNYIVLDSPLEIKFSEMHRRSMPVALRKEGPTFVRIVNKYTGRVRTYEIPQSFYVFHFARIEEDETHIKIYAPCYDEIDFSSLDIHGKYRKLILHKDFGDVIVEKCEVLENLNLDFPVPFNDKVIMRNLKNRICDGFVICRGLEIVKQIFIENRFVCGEPRIIYVKGTPYLIFFTFELENEREFQSATEEYASQGNIMLINLLDYHQIEIPLNVPLKLGFHSIFS